MTPEISNQPPAIRLELDSDRLAPERVRRALERLNHGIPVETVTVLQLLAGELVTNSVVHGRPAARNRIAMAIEVAPDAVRVEVSDGGAGFLPPLKPGALDDESGRGLLLVDRLADRWGVREGRPTRVWFEIDRC
jgi:anti-sigma regulatory factor (Ser/Thr protein kinase)